MVIVMDSYGRCGLAEAVLIVVDGSSHGDGNGGSSGRGKGASSGASGGELIGSSDGCGVE